MWLYNINPREGESLTVSFLDTVTDPANEVTVSQFSASLNFKVTYYHEKYSRTSLFFFF